MAKNDTKDTKDEVVVPPVVDDTVIPNGLPSAEPTPLPADASLQVEVGDPEVLRPVELPLVVKPANGASWKNDEQAEYAKILNAVAYSNPTLWAQVKNVEVGRLIEIGTNPDRYYFYTGNTKNDNLSFKNKLVE